ncbi:MAG: hypothetical protein MR902_02385 [Campylobacter sp.]|nr:hypothetical protein [Campylobacter sp.]
MFAAIIAAITAVALVAVYLLMPTPTMENAKSVGLDEFSFPTNSNGRVVPEVFGTCHVHGNIIWYGDLRSKEIRS